MKRVLVFLSMSAVYAIEKPMNLECAKQKVEQYYESCYYEREVQSVIHKALSYFKKNRFPAGSVVVFDIDDTLLSNYCEMKKLSFGFVPKLNHEWILQARAHAVPHIKALYEYCKQAGYDIILLSGRKESERAATIKNLNDLGFTDFKQLILRAQDEEQLTALAYKSAHRKTLVAQGLRIISCVGDQWSDLQGGYCGLQVKIPNYTYMIY